jgi:hypothetical protein
VAVMGGGLRLGRGRIVPRPLGRLTRAPPVPKGRGTIRPRPSRKPPPMTATDADLQMERAGAHLHVVGLEDHAALRGPEPLERQDQALE